MKLNRGEAELIQSSAGKDKKFEVITMFCCEGIYAPFTELSEAFRIFHTC